MSYKKTAKDLAHEREIQKLRTRINQLRGDVAYWKSNAENAHECASQFESLYLEALEHLDMCKEEFEKHLKETKAVNECLVAMNIISQL